MHNTLILSGAALFVGAICFGADDGKIVQKLAEKANPQAVVTAGSRTRTKPFDKTFGDLRVNTKQSADEEAIRQTGDSFVKAYERGDAKSFAAHFTADAEYVDQLGNVFQGRKAIVAALTKFFAANPGCKLAMNIDSIRFISPGVAVEDGSTVITRPKGSVSADSRYTKLHVKTDGKWLAASVRDHAPRNRKQHRAQLQQLEWLVGHWVNEGNVAVVKFSCRPVDNGNFLLRKFTIHIAGQEVTSGTQRIGWDPLTGKLRAWTFDSDGAYGEGLWHRDGDNWVLKLTGVMADGQATSSTSIYRFVDEHTMTWQSVDQEIAGVQQRDSKVVTVVRQSLWRFAADEVK